MTLSASRALANALRSTLWIMAYYSDMNEHGPTLHELKLAMGRAIVELEAEATFELNVPSPQPESAVSAVTNLSLR
jgi:hypothetical protein